MLYRLLTGFTDDIQVFRRIFLYRRRIQLFLLCVLASSLYTNLPIALMIVHFDGTPIHSLHTMDNVTEMCHRFYGGAKVPQPRHLVYHLYNASYDPSLGFVENSQTVITSSLEIFNTVDYPPVDPTTPSDLVQHAYSAYIWAFTDQLIGWIGICSDTSLSNSSGGTTEFSKIQTQIEHTSLLGSSDLDYFFDKNHNLFSNSSNETNSDKRQRDIALAQNQTLDILIPELAFNTTLSFMANDLLSYMPRLFPILTLSELFTNTNPDPQLTLVSSPLPP